MIRLAIAHSHQLVRTGIQRLLADEGGIQVVVEAGTAPQLLADVRRDTPDVVLLDVNLPDVDCMETTRRLQRIDADLKIVALGTTIAGPYPMRLMEIGVTGYVTQSSSRAELVAAVREVARGQRYMSPDVAQTVCLTHLDPTRSPLGALTPRELSVLVMLSQGHKRAEISDKLCVSPKTISTYRTRLLRKLGATSDVQLTHLSLQHGLIEPCEVRAATLG